MSQGVGIGQPETDAAGIWSFAVFPGHADELMAALDPALKAVVFEDASDGIAGWHDAAVRLGGEPPTTHQVRGLAFDLLLTPSQAQEVGGLLRRSAASGVFCWQAATLPRDRHFRLSDKRNRGMRGAMVGLGISLAIDLPHDGEVAVVATVSERLAFEAIERLRTANGWQG